jgi:hypothetical protein
MTESKTFFKYCSRCSDKFTPSTQGKICKKCKDKVQVLMHLERIKISLDKIINPKNDILSPERLPLEKKHSVKIKGISKKIEEEIKILKKELKIK